MVMMADWVPTHCINCGAYMGHGEAIHGECPEMCWDHDEEHPTHTGTYLCPVCHHRWQAIPPEDWDGSILVRKEKPKPEPPREYA